jgi:dTDP-4-dehydrorhamnose reductase
MKIAVIGADGQLGHDVVKAFERHGDEVCRLTHLDIELSNFESVTQCLRGVAPGLVVNTAAMHHVERCEQQPEKAYAVNATGSRNLGEVTREVDAVLVHVSTDYVFDGNKSSPYVENDLAAPLNVYGKSKLVGEQLIRETNPKHFILRTAALYGNHPCRAKGGQNFVDLMLRLAEQRGQVRVVDSEFTTPTATRDLARQIVALSRSDAYGLFHATAEGGCSWYEFAREIFSRSGVRVKLDIASPNEFPAKVPRPGYSILENRRLNDCGLNVFRPWQEGLSEYLSQNRLEVASLPSRA